MERISWSASRAQTALRSELHSRQSARQQSLRKQPGEEVLAVVFGKDTDTKPVIAAGAAKVLTAGSNELQAAEKAEILTKLVEKYQPKALYMAEHRKER